MRFASLVATFAVVATAVTAAPRAAEARDQDDCQRAWSQAVRSYLTTNRKAAPDGSIPKDMDEQELAAQAWMKTFEPACSKEAGGDKSGARIEAALIGVQVLSKLDAKGCERFMQYYMESDRGRDVCSMGTAGTAQLREKIAASIPKK